MMQTSSPLPMIDYGSEGETYLLREVLLDVTAEVKDLLQ